jgi:signal recognition particle subunit SRP19
MDEIKKWHCLYPAYINKNRTVAQGRRIPKEKAAVDPRWDEMRDVLESTGSFQVMVEPNKVYTRELDKEFPIFRGRVKYQVIKESDKFDTKIKVASFVAESIANMKNRKTLQSTASSSVSMSSDAPSGGKNKKGKKK